MRTAAFAAILLAGAASVAGAADAPADRGTIVVTTEDGSIVPLHNWSLSYEYGLAKAGTSPLFAPTARKAAWDLYVGKKPYPVTGQVLTIAYAESMLPPARSLWSADPAVRRTEFRVVGLALAACEKSAQRVYEQNLRPGEFQFKPWIDRVTGQLLAAYAALDQELLAHPRLFANERSHAAITAAVDWQFTQSLLASVVPASAHPLLCALSGRLERSAAFLKFPPDGPGVQPVSVGSP